MKPSITTLLKIWFSFGVQSFGGGATTLLLIRRAVVEEHPWITEGEFTYYWSLCQITPGINLVAFAILIGRRLRGWTGIAIAAVGMLLPSVTITILLTALYSHFQHAPQMQAIFKGVIPATIGLGTVTSYNMARPLVKDSIREGPVSLFVASLMLVGSALAILAAPVPVIVVLLAAGFVSGTFHIFLKKHTPLQDQDLPTEAEEL